MTHSKSIKSKSINPGLATDPKQNIAVFASAGSGKTHLLVQRILRLLLKGVDPANILAITFTRKAASEMHERLFNTLKYWASHNDAELIPILQNLAKSSTKRDIACAKSLYEKVLFSEHDIQITTFHAFCQDILKRFAFHAGVPAGFNVLENTTALQTEARQQLYELATKIEEHELEVALITLLKHCNTVFNVNQVLDTFLYSRIDWWSLTEQSTDAVQHATECLQEFLKISNFDNTLLENKKKLHRDLKNYCAYLNLHLTKTNLKAIENIKLLLQKDNTTLNDYNDITKIFFTKNKPKELKVTKTLVNKLGEKKAHEFSEAHNKISSRFEELLKSLKKIELLELNKAWYHAGEKLLSIYQRLKFGQYTLDFNDLEWYTYQLLSKHGDVSWVQYKLDQNIEHILVDEFQDTNPTQWNLLFPLLQEQAASSTGDDKSFFIVGDTKQSIYRFRRANPALQTVAADWAKNHLNALIQQTDQSYRSSPAIIKFVNKVFDTNPSQLENFVTHFAIQSKLWGRVQVYPLIVAKESNSTENLFRNPLLQARENTEINSHYQEGMQVAKRINEIIESSTAIYENGINRAANYSDILILSRNRTHLSQLEHALRQQNIPFQSINDEEFLKQLEVQDMLALLTFLIQPYNDMALAQTLKSPCFSFSDDDLMQLTTQPASSWHEKLFELSEQEPNSKYSFAYSQLEQWRASVNTVPVHDLLDKIYFEGNLLQRYAASVQPIKQTQVINNLTQLLQYALEINGGRYSSVENFLESIEVNEFKNCGSHPNTHNTVKILTIHSAKGLEAPIVFLVDTGSPPAKNKAYQAFVDWSSSIEHPDKMFIVGQKHTLDRNTQEFISQQTQIQWNEELNLLYVAITRASQFLYISGVRPKNYTNDCWYSVIEQSLQDVTIDSSTNSWIFESGEFPKIEFTPSLQSSDEIKFDKSITQPLKIDLQEDTHQSIEEEVSANYGTLVHKLFELGSKRSFKDQNRLRCQLEQILKRTIDEVEFNRAYEEFDRCISLKSLQSIFHPEPDEEVFTELEIGFLANGIIQHRMIDRMIVNESSVWIIDFKTTSQVDPENLAEQSHTYVEQMANYMHGVKKLYPQKEIRVSILYTHLGQLYTYTADELVRH